MDWNIAKQYYYLTQLVIVLYLSCTFGETRRTVEAQQPIVATDENGSQLVSRISPRTLLSGTSVRQTNGYVPIILSKPLTVETAIQTSHAKVEAPTINDISQNLTVNFSLKGSSSNSSSGNSSNSRSSWTAARNSSETIVPLLTISSDGSTAGRIRNVGLTSSQTQQSADTQHPLHNFNVHDVTRNLEIRLKNIRNIELGVTYVQEIFDAIDLNSGTNAYHIDAAAANVAANTTVLQLATRIRNKLEAVYDILDNLSEFISSNVTASLQKSNNSGMSIFLNTLIQPCPFDDFTLEQNYNKKQIQILNYLKINGYHRVDDLNFTINTQIVEALRKSAAANSAIGLASSSSKTRRFSPVDPPLSSANGDSSLPSSSFKTTTGSNFKHVFFLSKHDHASDHNCQYYFNDLNFRRLYVAAIRRKHTFLLIDRGNSLTGEQLQLSKQFASNVIQTLSEDDIITVVLIDSKPEIIQLSPDQWESYYEATMDRKDELLRRINQLVPSKDVTNHSLGFQYSFDLIRRQNIDLTRPLTFVYVTRGLLNLFTEAMNVLESIARGQAKLSSPIIINTCAVILDEKRIMYEKQFLQDIAQQNYTKYNINVSDWFEAKRHRIRGSMFIITKRHSELIIKTSTAIFARFFRPEFVTDQIRYHLPVLDYNTKDVIVAITKPIPQYGVAGINMYLNDLAEEIVYHRGADHQSYAFLIDISGRVIYHPAFSRPVATGKTPYPVAIELLEPLLLRRNSTAVDARAQILSEISGNVTVNDNGKGNVTFAWYRILNAYIVCLVIIRQSDSQQRSMGAQMLSEHRFDRYQLHINAVSSSELLYHRIDLIPPPQTPVCRHFRQIATLDTGTIFLSASAFKSPFVYFKNNREIKDETQRTHNAQSIMAYIKDITNLLANPGLQPQIRSDVSALLQVMSYLKKRHLENAGPLKKYIIRRYVATTNGVMQVYPGCILGADLEPSRRPWFRKAIRYPGRIVLTEPYLDAGGAGYIVSVAHTIFEGSATALHNAERDLPIAVVALDVPYAFFYKILLESTQLCAEANMKCLLLEDRGYLLAHPSMMEPATGSLNSRRPAEHLTHKESFVANDILNHKSLVQKRACGTFENRIVRRYYEFNTSLSEVLTNNVIHGERPRYQITAVPGTNIFAAVLNSTCDGGAFCPCSTVDRICLNCNRMDQTDCECPCECPMKLVSSDGHIGNAKTIAVNTTPTILDYCEPETEGLSVVNSLSYDWSLVIKSCISINCELYTTSLDCLGVMGCEWCQLDVDLNPFATPFCTNQNSCFNGVLGSTTPYGDGDLGSAIIEPAATPAYSAIGPVGGAIIALCLVVGFAMYCYRQNLDSGTEHLYGADSMQDDNYGMPLSRFNFDDISPHDDSDLSGGGGTGGGTSGATMMHRNLLHPLANALTANEASPYHVSTGGYRRPVNGESDHGYSTMTPHEDSEHMCFTLVEPLINQQHKQLSMSADSMSINTSVSSPTNHCQTTTGAIKLTPPPYQQLIAIDGPPPPTTTFDLISPKIDFVDGQTVLAQDGATAQTSPHHILAPVTVHRHMEAS